MTGYDDLAWFYDRYWATRYHDAAEPVLQRLLYEHLPADARVLDLCCGTGHLTQRVLRRGFAAIGIDASLGMLSLARRRVPSVPLVCAWAWQFALGVSCRAVVSTFDSMNHVMGEARLRQTFSCVHAALAEHGTFVFDVNTEEAYLREWEKSSAIVEPDAAIFVRGSYHRQLRTAETLITAFRLSDAWRRTDVRIEQRPLDEDSLVTALKAAGFGDIAIYDAASAGMPGEIAVGRIFVRARRDG